MSELPVVRDQRSDLLTQIEQVLGQHVALYPKLVPLAGSAKAALMLSQMIYWTRHGRDIARDAGWFFKTARQWQHEIGLTPKEQSRVRRDLRAQGLIEEQRLGLPAKRFFKVKIDAVAGDLGSSAQGAGVSDLSSGVAGLGRRIHFYRPLVDACASVNAAILLSRLVQRTQAAAGTDAQHWVVQATRQWEEDLGLSRRELEVARRELRARGLIAEQLTGAPRRLSLSVNHDRLYALLVDRAAGEALPPQGLAPNGAGAASDEPQRGCVPVDTSATTCSDPTDSTEDGSVPAAIVETRCTQTATSDSTKGTRWIAPNVHVRFDQTGSTDSTKAPTSIYRELQETHYKKYNYNGPSIGTETQLPSAGSCVLIFPKELLGEEREAAKTLLSPYPDDAQALLDELGARLHARTIKTCPLTYLTSLIGYLRAGAFVPQFGPRFALARRRAAEALRETRERRQAKVREEVQRKSPEFQATLAKRRADMRAFLDLSRSKRSEEPS